MTGFGPLLVHNWQIVYWGADLPLNEERFGRSLGSRSAPARIVARRVWL
jgi:hypothetical protein